MIIPYNVIFADEFTKLIKDICACDTSADHENWTAENPLFGHCAVVSLLAQDEFGGTLMRQSLEGIIGLDYLRSHYSNRLLNGTDVDFTWEQFKGKLQSNLHKEERERERLLSYPDTKKRYELLKNRFEALRKNKNL